MFIVEFCHSGIDFGYFQRTLGIFFFKISRQSISPATQKKRFKIIFSGLFYPIISKYFIKLLVIISQNFFIARINKTVNQVVKSQNISINPPVQGLRSRVNAVIICFFLTIFWNKKTKNQKTSKNNICFFF